MVIGTYVGLATIGGFGGWCMYAPDGPQVSFEELCGRGVRAEHSWVETMAVEGGKKVPMTVALTVLVTVEMFNALNALGDSSLLVVGPLSNPYLLGAIVLSFLLHFLILYVPWLASIFGVAPLDLWSWKLIVAISMPIVLVDEVMKIVCHAPPRPPHTFRRVNSTHPIKCLFSSFAALLTRRCRWTRSRRSSRSLVDGIRSQIASNSSARIRTRHTHTHTHTRTHTHACSPLEPSLPDTNQRSSSCHSSDTTYMPPSPARISAHDPTCALSLEGSDRASVEPDTFRHNLSFPYWLLLACFLQTTKMWQTPTDDKAWAALVCLFFCCCCVSLFYFVDFISG